MLIIMSVQIIVVFYIFQIGIPNNPKMKEIIFHLGYTIRSKMSMFRIPDWRIKYAQNGSNVRYFRHIIALKLGIFRLQIGIIGMPRMGDIVT